MSAFVNNGNKDCGINTVDKVTSCQGEPKHNLPVARGLATLGADYFEAISTLNIGKPSSYVWDQHVVNAEYNNGDGLPFLYYKYRAHMEDAPQPLPYYPEPPITYG